MVTAEINGQDEHPFAFDQTPWLQFSLNAGLQWKNFDFNMLLQGSALFYGIQRASARNLG